jgi:hypothetical protein
MDENFEDFDDGLDDAPVYHEPEYKLSELVEVNTLVEELAHRRGSLCTNFMREGFECMVSDPMMRSAREVFDAIARGDLSVVKVQAGDHPKQFLRFSDYMRDSFNDFLDRVDMFNHPTHTLHASRDQAQKLWPEMRPVAKKRPPLPKSREAEVVAFLNAQIAQAPLDEKAQQAAVEEKFSAYISRERLRKLPIQKRPQGRPARSR